MRFRQFAFAAASLDNAVDDLCAVLGLDVCFRDPGVAKFGLSNALIPLNGNFLEIVSPTQPDTTAGRYLHRRGGDSGYMIILQCDDALAERERIKTLGVREVWRHDEAEAVATHYHPADVPGAILSIDSMYQGARFHREHSHWRWAGPDWGEYVRTDRVQALVGVAIQSVYPAGTAAHWSKVLDMPFANSASGPTIELANAHIRFIEMTDERGLGIAELDVLPQDRRAIRAAADARGLLCDNGQVELCGLRVNLI